MKKALVLLYDEIEANGWNVRFVANVHDEWQMECGKKDAEAVGMAARQSIINAGVALGLRCPLDGEYKVGKNWKETH